MTTLPSRQPVTHHAVGGLGRRCRGIFLQVQGLRRVSGKVHQDPEQLIAIGIDHHLGGDIVVEHGAARGLDHDHVDDLLDQQAQREAVAARRGLLGPAIDQGLGQEADCPIERGDELRRDPLDRRILDAGQPVGDQLGGGACFSGRG